MSRYLNLALSRRRRRCEGSIERLPLLGRQLSPRRSSTASIACEYIRLETLTELRGELPLLQQFGRKLTLQTANDVFANHGKELECTVSPIRQNLSLVCRSFEDALTVRYRQ